MQLLLEHIKGKIDELNFRQFINRQANVAHLFPQHKAREDVVLARGGTKLRKLTRREWGFQVKSGTKRGVWYNVDILFDGIEETIKKIVGDMRFWISPKEGVDMGKLAFEVMQTADIKINCQCAADLFWAFHYIRTKYGAKLYKPELRRPTKRNVQQVGFCCKHCVVLMNKLHGYRGTMKRYLQNFYGDYIREVEAKTSKERAEVLKGAQAIEELPENKIGRFFCG